MILDFEPGDKVINPLAKEWGMGQVQSIIKENAIDNALKKLSDDNNVEEIIEELADEIASKNAFHVSKILDESLGGKKRGS